MPIEQLIGDLAAGVLVGKFKSFRAKPLRVYDRDEAVRKDALDRGVRSKIFELCHFEQLSSVTAGDDLSKPDRDKREWLRSSS